MRELKGCRLRSNGKAEEARGEGMPTVCVRDYLMLPNSHVRWGHQFSFIDVDDEGRSQPAPQMLGARGRLWIRMD